ncbi:MAG: hypothetical protein RL516_824 [Bacteroidota bacterium]|jgi:hypothetical protein
MLKFIFNVVCIVLLSITTSLSQSLPFQVAIEPLTIPNVGGLQSFAFGQHDGKWLIVGGRLDGLHRRQPFASFNIAGNNNQLIVIDPLSQMSWTSNLDSLSTSIREQLSSTNMEFHQAGNYLYLIGGYGYNFTSSSRKTFDQLTAIDIPQVINAVINNTSISPYIRQISDPKFAVTGGHLKRINQIYYLIGGNKFDGDYNPMGHATYTQQYTNAIRKFDLLDDGINLTINHYTEIVDSANLHRRDYNAVPQILPSGEEAISVFSGVFQPNIDLPYLNTVLIDSTNYFVNNNFQQHYNHYHCATLPVYSELSKQMHTVFFGGIAQFYDSLGILVQDNNVPFVKTVAMVSRDSLGSMVEYKMPIEMPGYFGASSEFIPVLSNAHFNNEVLKLDDLVFDTTLVGYIYGGINSSAANIFFTNNGTQSTASSQIYKVSLIKGIQTGITENTRTDDFLMDIYPNPNTGDFKIKIELKEIEVLRLKIYHLNGTLVQTKVLKNLEIGENIIDVSLNDNVKSSSYLIKIESSKYSQQRIIVVED